MRRPFTHRGGQRFRVYARLIPPERLGAGVLLIIGALHLTAAVLLSNSRAFLSPRFSLVIAAAFLAIVVIGTMSTTLLAMVVVVLPAMQLGKVSAAGIVFEPTLILGAALSIGLLFRLFSAKVNSLRAWTNTGVVSLCAVIAAVVAVVLSSIANGNSLSDCVPWLVAAGVALSVIMSARLGYLRSNTLPVALLIGFAISATTDVGRYFRGKGFVLIGANAGRFMGGLEDYELLAQFYAVAIVIALATLVRVRRLSVSLLALYVIGLGLFIVFATQVRSSGILLAIACPILLIALLFERNVSKPRVALIVAGAVSLTLALAPLILSSQFVARLLSTVGRGDFARTVNRSAIWPLIVTDPKFLSSGLFGNGPVGLLEWYGTYSHNLLLWTIWSLGIVGCVFLALLVATSISGILEWRKNFLVTGLLGFSLALLIAHAVTNEFTRVNSMILFVLALCAAVGASSISERGELLGRSME